VVVIAVTKGVPPAVVAAAAASGLEDFGENYVQELEEKRKVAACRWHFVGRLQRNKVHRVVRAVDLIHSVEPGSAARRLAGVAPERTVRCLVQVDFEGSRVGASPEGLERFVDEVAGPLDVRGLMTVPPLGQDPRPHFARLRELRDRLRGSHPDLLELSMGMSADYEDAVREGATMVRIGTAIFGPRPGADHRPPRAGKP
jgi:pyridoxal phosphate enzyme (YggS family)